MALATGRVTGEPESDEPDGVDDEVHRHRVHGVLGAREARLEHRESHLHEHYEKTATQHPRHVERLCGRFGGTPPPVSAKADVHDMMMQAAIPSAPATLREADVRGAHRVNWACRRAIISPPRDMTCAAAPARPGIGWQARSATRKSRRENRRRAPS